MITKIHTFELVYPTAVIKLEESLVSQLNEEQKALLNSLLKAVGTGDYVQEGIFKSARVMSHMMEVSFQ